MAATLKDVAQRAGVSTATVSYVINDSAPVSQLTRERVLRAIAELGYRPSYRGRSLRERQSHTLALVLPPQESTAAQLAPTILVSLSRTLADAGYYLLLTSAATEDEPALYTELAKTGRIDGAVLIGPQSDDGRLQRLDELKLPCVCLGRAHRRWGRPSVGPDIVSGARRAIGYLAAQGHRRIALLQQPSEIPDAQLWYAGYRRAIRAAGLPFDPELVVEGGPGIAGGSAAMEALLAQQSPPTAVLACDEQLALGALASIRATGLSVGTGISLISGGDSGSAASAEPPLTALHWPAHEIGVLLAQVMLQALAGEAQPRYHSVPSHLQIRRSTSIHA